MNIPKTKVVVFKKGPVLARNEQWTFGGQRLEVVNYFIYTVRHKLSIACLIFGSISPKANESFFACIRLKINLDVIDSLKQYEN